MMSILDLITLLSSLLLRLGAYIFLRWIPGHVFPIIVPTCAALYFPSFLATFLTASPYEVLADELDVTVTEQEIDSKPPDLPSTASHSRNLPNGDKPVLEEVEVDVQETVLLGPERMHILRTLLTGLPSPKSTFWSLITAGINVLLLAATLDLTYRSTIFYPSQELSFARVGFVSPDSAKILVREPDLLKLPLFLSYRFAKQQKLSTGFGFGDDSWKAAGQISVLTNETDFTSAATITRLRPDTRYQYALSNNHTGYFTTAPSPGQNPRRGDGKFTFLTTSCIKAHFPYNPLDHPLSMPGFRKLASHLSSLQAQFMLFLGDFIYIDVPHRFGSSAEDYRREYREVYSSPDWPAVSKELPWIHVLDDHEIANDWDQNTTGIYDAAVDPWFHYHTSVNPPTHRAGETYFSFVQGPASFFLLETRRYRSSEFAHPANSSEKTMLGGQQLADLLAWLQSPERPGVKWKIIASSVPFTKNWHLGTADTWGGYLAERQTILEAMWETSARNNVGVVVLSGDRHEFAATAFPPPAGGRWPVTSTVYEYSTGPLSQFYLPIRTYKQTDEEDVSLAYIPDGNFKFGAVEITNLEASSQSMLKFRLFVEGVEAWSHITTTPPEAMGKRLKDALWS